jgi:hypothetical protein
MGRRAGLAGLSSAELETLKKVYNQALTSIAKWSNRPLKARKSDTAYIILELKQLIRKEATHVS